VQQFINGPSIRAHVMMQRQVDARLFIVVEGDDEVDIYDWHLNKADVLLLAGGGKPALIEASELLHDEPTARTLILIDRDLDEIRNQDGNYRPNVRATVCYDLAADIVGFMPTVFDRLLVTHAKNRILASIQRAAGQPVSELAFVIARPISWIRLANADHGWGLNLRNFPMSEIVQNSYEPRSISRIIHLALARSKSREAQEDVAAEVKLAAERIGTERRYVGGHDLLAATAAILRIGGIKSISRGQLETGLCLLVDCTVMRALPVYSQVSEWATDYGKTAFTCAA